MPAAAQVVASATVSARRLEATAELKAPAVSSVAAALDDASCEAQRLAVRCSTLLAQLAHERDSKKVLHGFTSTPVKTESFAPTLLVLLRLQLAHEHDLKKVCGHCFRSGGCLLQQPHRVCPARVLEHGSSKESTLCSRITGSCETASPATEAAQGLERKCNHAHAGSREAGGGTDCAARGAADGAGRGEPGRPRIRGGPVSDPGLAPAVFLDSAFAATLVIFASDRHANCTR